MKNKNKLDQPVPDERSCWLCKNDDKSIYDLADGDIFIYDSIKYTYCGDGKAYSAPLNFCPVCGRKLPHREEA